MKHVRTFTVMIASPSDAVEEHAAVHRVIAKINVAARLRGVLLVTTSAKHDTYPTTSGHPQDSIDRQIVDEADILVAPFRLKLGTPTPSHASGTLQEIERHVHSGKPALLYFSHIPTDPNGVRSLEFARLKRYRRIMEKTRALTARYESLEDFEAQLERHLNLLIADERTWTTDRAQLNDSRVTPELAEVASRKPRGKAASASRRRRASALERRIEETAAYWTVKGETVLSAARRREMELWRAADARHELAYLRILGFWHLADTLERVRPIDGSEDMDCICRDSRFFRELQRGIELQQEKMGERELRSSKKLKASVSRLRKTRRT